MYIALILVASYFLCGCATLFSSPQYTSMEMRIAQFESIKNWPTEKKVKISWNSQMIPFVEAETDKDCAFSVGVVHAFLRLGQMELFKRGSAGRLSESSGPLVVPAIDEAIRKLDLGRSAQSSYEKLAVKDKEWLDSYIAGINFVISQTTELPYEYTFLDWEKEHWAFDDSMRIAHLAGGDANWANLISLLSIRDQKGWELLWKQTLESGDQSVPTIASTEVSSFAKFMSLAGRTGSNSVVVGSSKTKTKGAMIASDPHLGIFVPNLWLLMGYKSPSYHVLGYMLPGVPAVTLGRNQSVAWGGTYMRGVSTHLFEVRPEQIIRLRNEKIKRRWWWSKDISIKESVHGPVIYDGIDPATKKPQMIALNWVGHQPSNELGAFLSANRSTDWMSFRNSFKDYAVSGLNITYADKFGNIGFISAIRQPLLNDRAEQDQLIKSPDNFVRSYKDPLNLPSLINPKEGFIASANNMPVKTDPPLALVFAHNDRIRRWQKFIGEATKVTTQNLMSWQQDVHSEDSVRLKRMILANIKKIPSELEDYRKRLAAWNGEFDINSNGAVAFEILIHEMAKVIFMKTSASKKVYERMLSSDDWRNYLEKRLVGLLPEEQESIVVQAMITTSSTVAKFRTWGEYHVQVVQTPLGLIPLLGSRFRFGTYPSPGSSSTLHKAAFTSGSGPQPVVFGAQARHVSDLTNENENYFVMLGGNDGWLKNESMTDQVPLWREGRYLKIPLSLDKITSEFSKSVSIVGGGG